MNRPIGRDELLAQVYEHPEDDGPRLIYADWLSAQGEPLGEFILLQCMRARAGEQQPGRRELELWERFRYKWQGSLMDYLEYDEVVFRRGFLAECPMNMYSWMRLDDARRRWLIARPLWATVESLGCTDLELLRQPHLRSLRALGPIRLHHLGRLQDMAPLPRVQRLILAISRDPEQNRSHLESVLVDVIRALLPDLRYLRLVQDDIYMPEYGRFSAGDFAWLLSNRLSRDLVRIEIRQRMTLTLPEWLAYRDPRPDLMSWLLALRKQPELGGFALTPCHGWRFWVLRESGEQDRIGLHVAWNTAHATADLRVLHLAMGGVVPGSFARITSSIRGVARPHHRVLLEQILRSRGGEFAWADEPAE